METIENGMVVGADREYAEMYADSPSDNATPADFDIFAWRTECIADLMIHAFGLEEGDLTEDVARLIYTGLPCDFVTKCVEDWSKLKTVRERFDKYAEGK